MKLLTAVIVMMLALQGMCCGDGPTTLLVQPASQLRLGATLEELTALFGRPPDRRDVTLVHMGGEGYELLQAEWWAGAADEVILQVHLLEGIAIGILAAPDAGWDAPDLAVATADGTAGQPAEAPQPTMFGQIELTQWRYVPHADWEDIECLGLVTNRGRQVVRWVKIHFGVYDANGRMLMNDHCFSDPHDLAPGTGAHFKTFVDWPVGAVECRVHVTYRTGQ